MSDAPAEAKAKVARRLPILPRALAAWGGMRASMAAELKERPPEGRLLAYIVIALIILWASSIPSTMRTAMAQGEMAVDAAIGMSFGLYLLIMPLFYYGLAVGLRVLSRLFGGRAGFYEHRLALFWGMLVSMPALVALNAATLLVDMPQVWNGLSALATAVVVGHMLAEANGYRSVWRGVAHAVSLGAVLLALVAGLGTLASIAPGG